MKRSRRLQLAAAVAAIGLTAGCAQTPQSAQENQAQEDQAQEDQAKSQEEPIKVTVGGYYQGGIAVDP